MKLNSDWNVPDLMEALNERVVGQEAAKYSVASALWWNRVRRRLEADGADLSAFPKKDNVLLAGPSGCGKTLIIQTASELVGVPVFSTSATEYSSVGYVGRNTSQLLTGLMDAAEGDLALASGGVVFIDEVDKIRRTGSGADVGGEGVQQGLLTLLEGTSDFALERKGMPEIMFRPAHVTFIAAGAFTRINHDGSNDLAADELISAGLIPELVGRFTRLARVVPLADNQLRKILKDSSITSLVNLYAHHGIKLAVNQDAVDWIMELVQRTQVGARGLAHSVDRTLSPLRDVLPIVAECQATKVLLDARTIQSEFSDLRYFTRSGNPGTLDVRLLLQGRSKRWSSKTKPSDQPPATSQPRERPAKNVASLAEFIEKSRRPTRRGA